jgi:CDP-6-deoxy-D-xylo-4-hexulose-3-dehydrase
MVKEYCDIYHNQDKEYHEGNLINHPCFDEMWAAGEGYRVVGDLTNTNQIMNNMFWGGAIRVLLMRRLTIW